MLEVDDATADKTNGSAGLVNSPAFENASVNRIPVEPLVPRNTDVVLRPLAFQLEMISRAPKFVRKFAVGNVEDFAGDKGYDCVTVAVVEEQMESAGMGRFKRKAANGDVKRRWWWPFS